jgi:hypothetical protein
MCYDVSCHCKQTENGSAQRLTVHRMNFCYIHMTVQNICSCYMTVFESTDLGIIIRWGGTGQLRLQSKQVVRSRSNAFWFRLFSYIFLKSCLLSILCYVSFHCKLLPEYVVYCFHMNRMTRCFRFMVPCSVFQYVNLPNLMSLYIYLF